jgi:Integrase core domain
VKFLTFKGKDDKPIKRYQYTAIDDATRIRSLKIYECHNQVSAISFIDYVIAKFPFHIREVRTDSGHEFQAKFHWHVEDLGIRYAYIEPSAPQPNGKVERSHRADEQEFYQLLTYKDDVDLNIKLAEWESFYNLSSPHGTFDGRTPYEILRERLLFKSKFVSRDRPYYIQTMLKPARLFQWRSFYQTADLLMASNNAKPIRFALQKISRNGGTWLPSAVEDGWLEAPKLI